MYTVQYVHNVIEYVSIGAFQQIIPWGWQRVLIFAKYHYNIIEGQVWGDLLQPSSGEPPALPWHAHREADDLVGQLWARQTHPKLEPVAESHHPGTGQHWMEGTPAASSPGFNKFLVPKWVDALFTFRNISVWYALVTEPTLWCVHPSVIGAQLKEAWTGAPQVSLPCAWVGWPGSFQVHS